MDYAVIILFVYIYTFIYSVLKMQLLNSSSLLLQHCVHAHFA